MKLCIISDTHTKHNYIGIKDYEADVIIHCGDISGNGGIQAITEFLKWFGDLEQFKHKIFIAGNHDWLFERANLRAREVVPDNVIYLEDEEVVIDGVKFYGTPVQKPFCNWAFNKPEGRLVSHWQAIPDNTDVLITHSPPYSIGDYVPWNRTHHGSPSLYKEIVERIKPKIHCFGHIHEGYGIKHFKDIIFINASCLDENYYAVNDPIIINI